MSTDPDIPHTSAAGLMEHVAAPCSMRMPQHKCRIKHIRHALEGQVDVMSVPEHFICTPSRRRFLQSAGILGGMVATFRAGPTPTLILICQAARTDAS